MANDKDYRELEDVKRVYETFFKKPVLIDSVLGFLKTKNNQLEYYNYYSDKDNLTDWLAKSGVSGLVIIDLFEKNGNNSLKVLRGYYKESYEKDFGPVKNKKSFLGLYLDSDSEEFLEQLTNSDVEFYRLILDSNGFTGFPARALWYSPIEYYLEWKIEKLIAKFGNTYSSFLKSNVGPISLLNKQIRLYGVAWGYFDLFEIKDFFIDGKEKFGKWVVNGVFVKSDDDKIHKPLEFLANKVNDTEKYKDFLKLIYIIIEDFLDEYSSAIGMSNFEEPDSFKKSVRKLILSKS